MHGSDLTPGVENGLAYFYLAVALANGCFAWFQGRSAGSRRWTRFWWLMAGVSLVHAAAYLLHNFVHGYHGPVLPHWIRDLSDYGLSRGLTTLGVPPDPSGLGLNGIVSAVAAVVLYVLLGVWALDALASYVFKGSALGKMFRDDVTELFGGAQPQHRMVLWWLLISIMAVIIYGTGAVTYFVLANAVFCAALVWRRTLTEPNVAWLILNAMLFFGGWSMTDPDFRGIIGKPDNVPIVFLVFTVAFFTWLPLRRAVLNDERKARNEPNLEKLEDEKVLVWPDLVYTELICMIVCTVLLTVWAVALPAPLEQPASSTKTPNPSKAPWYFLGLQEMLVYYDPWLAGVVFPTIIIVGLMAIPYIDFNQKGNGYYTFAERSFSIFNFLYGFIVLWVVLIFLGTFLRGPNWNFFGLYEYWDPHKLVPLNNVNLSDYFWIRGFGKLWEHPPGQVSILTILLRESPGIVLILLYFIALPPLLARTVLRDYFLRMGFIRYIILVSLLLFMASLPIKMVLRWSINLKYIVAMPEYFFHI